MVNRAWGDPESQFPERHDASDFDKLKTKAAELLA
jgi:GST-like protein